MSRALGWVTAAVVMGLTEHGRAMLADDVPVVRIVGVLMLESAARICEVAAALEGQG